KVWTRIAIMWRRHRQELGPFLEDKKREGFDYLSKDATIDCDRVDEYDAPLNDAFANGYYEEASRFFGAFYSFALKDNPYLHKACLMGIVEVRGAGILSGLNNISVYSVDSKEYSSCFGFTKDEILPLVEAKKLDIGKVTHWYNGYIIGDYLMVNPWSIMNYVKRGELRSYWITSSYTESIAHVLEPQSIEVLKQAFALICLEGDQEYSVSSLDTKVNYSNDDWNVNSIFHFFYTNDSSKGFVRLPNYEVRLSWEQEIMGLLGKKYKPLFGPRIPPLGRGRSDVVVDFGILKRVYIFEFKHSKSKVQLDSDSDGAL
ncbi:hypothetical protein MP638_003122, partial [Amoeboaphelidium occidentale]